MRRIEFVVCLLFLACTVAFADPTPVLKRLDAVTFDPAIPSVQSVLGYDLGQKITSYDAMNKYFQALAASSPSRVKIEKFGRTYEGRDLQYIIIASPENIARLDSLKAANLRLADPRTLSSRDADALIENQPVFVCLSYTVHGDEHSSTEAAMGFAYYLLASTDPEAAKILKNAVIMIDPMENPDGHERFVDYFYSTTGKEPNEDQNAAEHTQTWPGGRYNHYLFDLNRDWTTLSQMETRERITAYRQYQPHVFIDFHEMGSDSSYFFPPPGIPQNPNLPKSEQQWWNTLGKAIAAEFDKNRIDYYTAEHFDFWYPGYGDSWPTYNGALSATFEQGSTRGLVVKRYDGIVVHYQDAIWHHFLSSLATCKMAAANRKEKLRDFYDFRASAIQEGKTGPVREFLIRRSADPYQADRLVEQLLFQGVEVRQARGNFKTTAAGYFNDSPVPVEFQKGDYIVPMDQPLKRLVQILLEKESPFDKTFLEAEKKRKEEGEPSEIYDITAWALPLAYGADTWWAGTPSKVDTDPVRSVTLQAVDVPPSDYAYLINYASNRDLATVFELMRRNIRVYFSQKPFRFQGSLFNAGSFIIKRKDNPDNLRDILTEVARTTGSVPVAAATGWTDEGPDVGSDYVLYLQKPKIAVLMGTPTDATSYGAIDYLFDQRYGVSFTPIQAMYLSWADLSKYNVIIMPDAGWRTGYKKVIDSGQIAALKTWVQNGGTLIAIQGAAAFLADNGELTDVKHIDKYIKDSDKPAPVEKEDEKEKEKPATQAQQTESPDFVLGAIADARINRHNFLGYGYNSDNLPVFLYSSNVFAAPEKQESIVTYRDAEHIKVAGLLWDIARKRLSEKSYATAEEVGRGRVILFAEDPNFRAAWDGLTRLFINGALFGPSMNPD